MVNASNDGMAITTLTLTLIEGLEHDSLATSKATGSEDDNLTLLKATNEAQITGKQTGNSHRKLATATREHTSFPYFVTS